MFGKYPYNEDFDKIMKWAINAKGLLPYNSRTETLWLTAQEHAIEAGTVETGSKPGNINFVIFVYDNVLYKIVRQAMNFYLTKVRKVTHVYHTWEEVD